MRVLYKRDIDGFFGLAVDNLVQLLLTIGLFAGVLQLAAPEMRAIVFERILPGAAVSIVLGNLVYAVMAHILARRESRDDVCALPYGINTPSLLVFFFFVIQPAYAEATAGGMSGSQAAELAWQLGLVACFGSTIIEFFGAFVAERIRKNTPRAALLGTLSGIAIAFISMTFALQIWQSPLVAMLPLAVILLTYFAGVRFWMGMPGGLLALVLGTGIAWLGVALQPYLGATGLLFWGLGTDPALSSSGVNDAWQQISAAWGDPNNRIAYFPYLPVFSWEALWAVLAVPDLWLKYLAVIVPMGLFNVIGSLQNIESAEAGGDRYPTGAALATNGIGSLAAALFGSCFPTTIYIGHPGWKALGARAGYSTLNGLFFVVICCTGLIQLVTATIPLQAGVAIVLWIGIIITAQAFTAVPARHAPAVAIGLFPAVAAWGAAVTRGAFAWVAMRTQATGGDVSTVPALLDVPFNLTGGPFGSQMNGFLIWGMVILEQGYILTCMIMAATTACLIDRRFRAAGLWMIAAAVFTTLGLMHGFMVKPETPNVVDFYFVVEDLPGVTTWFEPQAANASAADAAAVDRPVANETVETSQPSGPASDEASVFAPADSQTVDWPAGEAVAAVTGNSASTTAARQPLVFRPFGLAIAYALAGVMFLVLARRSPRAGDQPPSKLPAATPAGQPSTTFQSWHPKDQLLAVKQRQADEG